MIKHKGRKWYNIMSLLVGKVYQSCFQRRGGIERRDKIVKMRDKRRNAGEKERRHETSPESSPKMKGNCAAG